MTPNKAASETRLRIQRKIRSLCDKYDNYESALDALSELKAFISTMDDRQNKRKGGLGRKRK